MIDFEADMANVFYGSDFACAFVRQRAGVANETVKGIPGRQDKEALDGHVLAAQRQLLLPASAGLKRDDTLTAVADVPQWSAQANDVFKVLDLEHVGDGTEVLAHIGKAGQP